MDVSTEIPAQIRPETPVEEPRDRSFIANVGPWIAVWLLLQALSWGLGIPQARLSRAVEAGAAEEIEREEHEERGAGRQDRARQGLVDAEVDHLREARPAHLLQVLAHAIGDDDRVVHREADHGEHRGERREVEDRPRHRRSGGPPDQPHS